MDNTAQPPAPRRSPAGLRALARFPMPQHPQSPRRQTRSWPAQSPILPRTARLPARPAAWQPCWNVLSPCLTRGFRPPLPPAKRRHLWPLMQAPLSSKRRSKIWTGCHRRSPRLWSVWSVITPARLLQTLGMILPWRLRVSPLSRRQCPRPRTCPRSERPQPCPPNRAKARRPIQRSPRRPRAPWPRQNLPSIPGSPCPSRRFPRPRRSPVSRLCWITQRRTPGFRQPHPKPSIQPQRRPHQPPCYLRQRERNGHLFQRVCRLRSLPLRGPIPHRLIPANLAQSGLNIPSQQPSARIVLKHAPAQLRRRQSRGPAIQRPLWQGKTRQNWCIPPD